MERSQGTGIFLSVFAKCLESWASHCSAPEQAGLKGPLMRSHMFRNRSCKGKELRHLQEEVCSRGDELCTTEEKKTSFEVV